MWRYIRSTLATRRLNYQSPPSNRRSNRTPAPPNANNHDSMEIIWLTKCPEMCLDRMARGVGGGRREGGEGGEGGGGGGGGGLLGMEKGTNSGPTS